MKKQHINYIEQRLNWLDKTAGELEDLHLEVKCYSDQIRGRLRILKREEERHGKRNNKKIREPRRKS